MIFKKIILFIYLFLAVLGLSYCRAFSSCGVGVSLHCNVQASHCGDFYCHGVGVLGCSALGVAACRLSS